MMPENKQSEPKDNINEQTAPKAEKEEKPIQQKEKPTKQEEKPTQQEEKPTQQKEKKPAVKKKKENEFETKFNQLNDSYLRMLAEYDNFRKRTLKEKEGMFSDGILKVVTAILPVIDNFERALASDCGDGEFKNGIDMIYKQFLTALQNLEIKELICKGETFDPSKHNAIMHIDDEQYGENEVIEIFQKGYLYKDETVIRHAVVKVAN